MMILIFGRPLSEYTTPLLMNVCFVIIILSVLYFLKDSKKGVGFFIRLLYPALLFTFFYEQTGDLMRLFFPEFLDSQLTGFEKSIFGVNPTIWLDKNLINVWITEILMFCYGGYYFMIILFLVPLFLLKKYDIIKMSLTAICPTFFISYLLFILYPIEGPRHFFADQFTNVITGPVFRSFVDLVISEGAVHGGCMPSSHVAVALVIMIFCLKYFRKIGIVLVPINVGLALGTVYGRFHYVSDVIVGVVIGLTMTWLVMKYYNPMERKEKTGQKKESIAKYVS
jgi:membrane-associated phospholipid phosphatase